MKGDGEYTINLFVARLWSEVRRLRNPKQEGDLIHVPT